MTIWNRLILALTSAFIISVFLVGCGNQVTTTDIVKTSQAQNKLDNATATAEIVIAKGGDPDSVEVEVKSGSSADKHNISMAATAKAEAAEGIVKEGVGGSASDELAQGGADWFDEEEIPDGSAESGVIVIDMPLCPCPNLEHPESEEPTMVFAPKIVKITLGSTVKWTNFRRSASSTTADPGQADHWDSDSFKMATFAKKDAEGNKLPGSFEHTFNTVGCFTYKSNFSGDLGVGAICVVEK